MSVLSQESGGDYNVGCVAVDIQNYLGSRRRKLLKCGDAQRMYNYFKECQAKNPGFIYAIQVDENNCMGNCFWADARSRLAYQYFGDVVSFDATYLTNCYSMPFVPFTGVNHHHQSIMFGCALLVNETTDSYIWLLQTWLEAMLGRAPSTIITDDDKAMAKAITQVLPNTTHRLCMWHILQKIPEHLAHVYNTYPSFRGEFHQCIHDTITITEFEMAWNELILRYELGGNSWLQDLHARREKWIPAYLRTTFCAGMSTTQRSESMNKFFKDFVHSSTLVSDFVFQYEKALNARYLKEKEKDVKTKNSCAILKTCYRIEAEAAEVYTRKLFNLFQKELFSSHKYKACKNREDSLTKTYTVLSHENHGPVYEVSLYFLENKAICTCHMFEFIGILCRHVLTVFIKKSLVNSLPQQYVLERWTMNAKRRVIHEISNYDVIQEDTQICSTLRRSSLMIQFLQVAEEGQKSQKKCKHLGLALEKVHNELLSMDDESEGDENGGDLGSKIIHKTSNQVLSSLEFTLADPLHVPSRGRPKSLRQNHPIENKAKRKKRKCSNCKEIGHFKSNCPSEKKMRHNAGTNLSPINLGASYHPNFDEAVSPRTLDPSSTTYSISEGPKHSTFMDLMLWAMKGRPEKMKKKQPIAAHNTKRDPSEFEYANTIEEIQQIKNATQRKQSMKKKIVLKDLTDEKFIEQVLALFNPKIKEYVVRKLEDVAPDGHCGFRACAKLLGKSNNDGWMDVRRSMLDELREHRESYIYQLGGEKNYKVVERALDYFSEYGCGKKYWMQLPEMGLLFASTFNCVFCVLSPLQSCTYLPLRTGPPADFQIIPIILYDDSDFMKILLKQDAPIPKIVPWWYKIRSEDASNWEVLVNSMVNDWEVRVSCP